MLASRRNNKTPWVNRLQLIQNIFTSNLNRLLPTDTPLKIGIAVSGGADSMCLAALINAASNQFSKIIALIVDHGLRANSLTEAKWVQQYLEEHNIATQVLIWEGPKPTTDIQNAARKMRYKLLLEACKSLELNILATAHTQNDQAETVLMRLLHGSGTVGLKGIAELSQQQGVYLLRPMLNISKERIIEYLHNKAWQWVEDPSNQNSQYERIALRKILQNLPAQHSLNICHSSRKVARCDDFIATYTLAKYQELASIDEYGAINIDKTKLIALHEEVIYRILKIALKQINRTGLPIKGGSLAQLQQKLLSSKGRCKFTFYGCEIINNAQYIKLFRELASMPMQIMIKPNEHAIWDGNNIINDTDNLALVRPLGIDGLEQLKKLLPKAQLPAKVLYVTPALFSCDGKLLKHLLLLKKEEDGNFLVQE